MTRLHNLFLLGVAAILLGPTAALAASISLSLNLTFNTPGDPNSGGTWFVVGKADERGLAGVSMYLTNINFNAAGFLAPVQFEVRQFGTFGTAINIVEGDDPFSKTLDVGVVGGPFPSSYVDAPGLTPYLGNSNLGSFTGGVALATGTFNSGVVPNWTNSGSNSTDGNVYSSPAGANAIDAATSVTVRTVVPEPAMLGVAGVALIGLIVASRRSRN
jgi:hypothetical protein